MFGAVGFVVVVFIDVVDVVWVEGDEGGDVRVGDSVRGESPVGGCHIRVLFGEVLKESVLKVVRDSVIFYRVAIFRNLDSGVRRMDGMSLLRYSG